MSVAFGLWISAVYGMVVKLNYMFQRISAVTQFYFVLNINRNFGWIKKKEK